MIQVKSDEELIKQYIAPDRYVPGPVEVRVKDYHKHVWALAGDLRACSFDVESVAKDHRIPVEYVEAALAYYRRYPEIIEARLAENEV